MTDITYADKTTGSQFTASDANEIKNVVNIKANTVNKNLSLSRLERPGPATVSVNSTAGLLVSPTAYSITFVTASGETEHGPSSTTVSPSSEQVDLTNIPVSSDGSVISRNIYRYPAGVDTVLKQLVVTINDNTTTTYTDNILDASLGVPIPYINTVGGLILLDGVRSGSVSVYSVSLGYGAMENNTGYANTAIGPQAMAANTTGLRNVAIGTNTMQANTIGVRNVAIGVHASNQNMEASDVVAVGYGALFSNLANKNTAVGAWSLYNNTTGQNNTATGYFALRYHTTGANNTANGSMALQDLTTGNFNTAVGYGAISNVTTKNFNTAIGFNALSSCVSGEKNIAIGASSGQYETGSNKLFIDNNGRTDEATARIGSLIYGEMSAVVSDQYITFNANATWRPAVSVTPANNGELTFEATSDTSVTVKMKGSDGVVRSAVLTLS